MGKNLTLTGMMGAGKSTIGKILAKKLKYRFIDVDKNILQISGIKKRLYDEGVDAFKRERIFGKFARSFRLSEDVVKDEISANFKEGVLSIVLPKNQESLSKKINIE